MLSRLLSNDLPRSRVLAVRAGRCSLLGAGASRPSCSRARRRSTSRPRSCVFIVLVASFDLLLGYTGIVSFAHTMFFGIGAYGVAIALDAHGRRAGPRSRSASSRRWRCRSCWRCAIGLFSLRVRAIFFAMITLAVAAAFQTLASQLSDFTGGEDGLTFKMPELLSPGFAAARQRRCSASRSTAGCSPTTCCSSLRCVLFLALLRIVNSPFGRVLQAIRENEFRAEAIGYRIVVYRTMSSVLSALFATLAGAMLALWLRYNGPDTTLSLRDHARRAADRRDRRHGHDLRRGDRRRRCSSSRRATCRTC